ncbi:dUTP diphosphatase [Desulfogranum mediterraneum]|uniref:dUTP diphosphatase n=1 Tax=Desulfogranum mediterraneum TaxID=160661 RepID=UPI0003FE2571|nr:dUTP diphosphatase [Desulfogranum mediterraneum]
MKQVKVGLSWLCEQAQKDIAIPGYETALAAGMDVGAVIASPLTIGPGERTLVPCGFALAIPAGYEVQVRPRSGLAVKHGITVINGPGTIDADYRGEVKVALVNLSAEPFTIQRGDRIAQLILAPVVQACLEVVAELDETDRGAGGFGHTGLR